VLGFELKTLHLLGRCCITWTMPTVLFASDRVLHFCPGCPNRWDYRCTLPCPVYLLRYGSLTNFLPRLASNLVLPYLCLLSSWDYRYKPQHSVREKLLKSPSITVHMSMSPFSQFLFNLFWIFVSCILYLCVHFLEIDPFIITYCPHNLSISLYLKWVSRTSILSFSIW
jgi:hypothetical protein